MRQNTLYLIYILYLGGTGLPFGYDQFIGIYISQKMMIIIDVTS